MVERPTGSGEPAGSTRSEPRPPEEGSRGSFLRELPILLVVALGQGVLLAALVILVLGTLWGYTGQPLGDSPVVVVESGSMMHCKNGNPQYGDDCRPERYGRLGFIDPGDLILVKDIDRAGDVGVGLAVEPVDHGRHGVEVLDVVKDSPADEAGLRPEDVIVALAEQPTASVDDLHKLLVQLPVGIPAPVVRRLNADIVKIVALPEVQERLKQIGFVGVGNSPEEHVAQIRRDLQIMAKAREAAQKGAGRMSLDQLFQRMQTGSTKDLNVILKADVQGSIEALTESLERLSTDEVKLKVIHYSVGAITESDVMLASASNAIVLGFNVKPDAKAAQQAQANGVDVRTYSIIYEVINDLKAALSPEEYDVAAPLLSFAGKPNFEEKYYYPQFSKPWPELLKETGLSDEELAKRLAAISAKLLAVRSERARPRTDEKILTANNGLMIGGFADAGRMLKNKEYVARAAKAADFVLTKLRSDDGRHVVIRPLAYVAEADLAAYAEARRFPIIPCTLCGSQDNLQRKQIGEMLRDWERRQPGRIESIVRALAEVRPSHLLDRKLYDFARLK